MQRRTLVIAAGLIGGLVAAHAKETPMTTPAHEVEIAQRLIDLHFSIWNDPDPAARFAKFASVYTPDFFVADYAGKAADYQAVNALIDRVQGEHAGFVFTPEPISWNHGLGRVTWGYGPKDQPRLIRGEDIFTVSSGRLSSAYVFIDQP